MTHLFLDGGSERLDLGRLVRVLSDELGREERLPIGWNASIHYERGTELAKKTRLKSRSWTY